MARCSDNNTDRLKSSRHPRCGALRGLLVIVLLLGFVPGCGDDDDQAGYASSSGPETAGDASSTRPDP